MDLIITKEFYGISKKKMTHLIMLQSQRFHKILQIYLLKEKLWEGWFYYLCRC